MINGSLSHTTYNVWNIDEKVPELPTQCLGKIKNYQVQEIPKAPKAFKWDSSPLLLS
jgi:hypothetical protein